MYCDDRFWVPYGRGTKDAPLIVEVLDGFSVRREHTEDDLRLGSVRQEVQLVFPTRSIVSNSRHLSERYTLLPEPYINRR